MSKCAPLKEESFTMIAENHEVCVFCKKGDAKNLPQNCHTLHTGLWGCEAKVLIPLKPRLKHKFISTNTSRSL